MESMDGERIWSEFSGSLSDVEKERYHRLNITLRQPEPMLDDYSALDKLKATAKDAIRKGHNVHLMQDIVVASMFYFEFDKMPVWRGTAWHCEGSILCRLELSLDGRRALYERLRRSTAFFFVFGTPVSCVDQSLRGTPSFRRRIHFSLPTLLDDVRITLGGITSAHVRISGLPRTARDLLELQQFDTPFGRADHSIFEKRLPELPVKRKRRRTADRSYRGR
jgi:hypothetical protein